MRLIERDEVSQLFLSVLDTRVWAKQWPGSKLGGKRIFAEWDKEGTLTEFKVDGFDDFWVSDEELNALFAANLPEDHPSQV